VRSRSRYWVCSLARYGWPVVADTLAHGSNAPTGWATPMILPQSAWYASLLTFTFASVWLAVRAFSLLLRGRHAELERSLKPRALDDELREELEDVARR